MDQPMDEIPPTSGNATIRIVLIIGVMVFAAFLICAGLIGWGFYHTFSKQADFVASIAVPAEVAVGDECELVVEVQNTRANEALELTDIDLASEFFDGFIVASTTPRAKSSQTGAFDRSRSFTFGQSLPAGQSATFTFRLRAVKAGRYMGDVDVWEGMNFVTQVADIVVREKD